jgi:hypothetical protein
VTAAGYIRLHRALLEHPIFAQLTPTVLKVWIGCLLRANWRESRWYDGQNQVPIPAGAFAFSQDTLSKFCGVSRQELRTALNHLLNLRSITIRSTKRYSLLVIENWSTYQADAGAINQEGNQTSTNNQPSSNQDLTIEEEVKKLRTKEGKPICASDDARAGVLFAVEQPKKRKLARGELTPEQQQWFEEWWPLYWRHCGKKDAIVVFSKAVRTPERFRKVLEATQAQTDAMLARPEDKRPYPATWLRGERWQDEAPTAAPEPEGTRYYEWDPPGFDPKQDRIDRQWEAVKHGTQ